MEDEEGNDRMGKEILNRKDATLLPGGAAANRRILGNKNYRFDIGFGKRLLMPEWKYNLN